MRLRVSRPHYITLIWLVSSVMRIARRHRRFIALTPPILSYQLLFDFRMKRFIKCFIRDWIDFCTFTQIFLSDCYNMSNFKRNFDIEDFVKDLHSRQLRPLIIDCGGNIGLATKYFLETFPESVVACIEPENSNLKQARLNNQDSRVTFFEAAIGPAKARANVFDPHMGNDAYQIQLDAQGLIQVLTVEDIVTTYDANRVVPFIIKIDIEGYESELFKENFNWIESFPIIIVELHDWLFPGDANSKSFLNAIAQYDRDFIFVGANVFSFSNILLARR